MLINDICDSFLSNIPSSAAWEDGVLESRLIAEDGEIVARVRRCQISGEYIVDSNGKRYVSRDQAKAAAVRIKVEQA